MDIFTWRKHLTQLLRGLEGQQFLRNNKISIDIGMFGHKVLLAKNREFAFTKIALSKVYWSVFTLKLDRDEI